MSAMTEQEFQDHLRQCNWQMREKIEQNRQEFKIDSFLRFDWDPWRGELVFSSGGTPKVVARIQVVGTWSIKAGSWLWAWANTTLFDSVRQAAIQARKYGEERGLLRLMQPRWAAKESDAWEMTALAFKLSEAKGAFKSPSQEGFTFMVFTDIREVSDRKRVFGTRTCSHVLEEDRPVLLVSRETNGEVLALCGGDNDSSTTLKDVQLSRLLDQDPTLGLLADLPDGWVALRETADDDWVRSKSD